MAEKTLAKKIEEERVIQTARFLIDLVEFKRLYGEKANLDKSLYFINYPKEDFN